MEITPVNRQRFYTWIIETLSTCEELTAREVADYLYHKNLIPLAIRQATAPRLTELVKMGRVEVCGSKVDADSKKRVSVYRLVKDV